MEDTYSHISSRRPQLLIVDDEYVNRSILKALLNLNPDYEVFSAESGTSALQLIAEHPEIDLVLLDILMPGMSGYEVCQALKSNPETAHIRVIFVTAMSHDIDEEYGLKLGAVDYITKPYSPTIVLARVHTHLTLAAIEDALRHQNELLEVRVQERTQELQRTQDATILCLASLAETRDNETGAHILRTQNYVRALAIKLQDHDHFQAQLPQPVIDLLYKSAPLHDIGKVGVPDYILLKQGKLTPDEWQLMRQHTTYGYNSLLMATDYLGSSSFLKLAAEIALTHHEKWDGSGYPQGLKGNDIPLSGRLMALADVYDALISRRCYKEPYPHEEAVRMIVAGSGTHFDPDIVNAFLELKSNFNDIALAYTDAAHGTPPHPTGKLPM
ncbi:response regulator [Sulfuriferula nivalis]|uniref:Two-component system response regulator n=1 Tax=Sulfuriferula nivalis TaxID=2675298 RepID=A0A809SI57_9PROT|nr:two-component system response regulator [Sulfuriferula nivalis]BBP01450.1 two-component system response regulator [Sulfuriferula nivalis]